MKKLWTMLLVVAIVGLALMAAGFAIGVNPSAIYINKNGLHMADEGKRTVQQEDTDRITGIEISVASADIEIIPSNTYGFAIDSADSSDITYAFNNGTLKIDQSNDNTTWRMFNFDFDKQRDAIKIYLPADNRLKDVIIKTLSGKITIDGIQCQDLDLQLASGDTHIQNAVAEDLTVHNISGHVTVSDIEADEFDFKLTSGNLDATGIRSDGLSVQMVSGKATIEGRLTGDNDIKLTSGVVNLLIEGSEQDYSRSISIVSGHVYVNGAKNNNDVDYKGADNSLDIDLTSGNVNIDFES